MQKIFHLYTPPPFLRRRRGSTTAKCHDSTQAAAAVELIK